MAIVRNVMFEGSNVIRANNGDIEINNSTGEMIIRRGGRVRTRVNADGFVYSDNLGLRRIQIGSNPSNPNDVISAISDPNIDVINELS